MVTITTLADKVFDKQRAAALEKNKDLKEQIKSWRNKSGYILRSAYETQEIFKLAASGKPIPEGPASGADAAWAEVFASQENQKEKAKEALAMMQRMNEQADDCGEEMHRQTDLFKDNINKAEDVTEGLKEAMGKLQQLTGGLCTPCMVGLNITTVICVLLAFSVLTGGW